MAFSFPTLSDLVQRARAAFRTELPGSDAWVWPNNLNVSAKVMAAMTHMNFQWLNYIGKQRWISTADGEFLDRHGVVYGVTRLGASFASGEVDFAGTPGTVVPSGIFVEGADRQRYEVTTPATVPAGGTVTLKVGAQTAGKAGNALAGVEMTLTAALEGLESKGVVATAGIGGGADEETDESYRARLLHRVQLPPHGGAAHDYVAWAREIAGVTRVYVDPLALGAGTVTVYFLMDDLYADGIPQAADVALVQDYINSVRPVTALVTVAAPTAVAVDITITGLDPDTQAVRDAISAELQDLFLRSVGVSTVADPFTLYRSKLWEAISQASGEDHHELTVPATDTAFSAGELPVLGTITYSS